MSPDPDVRLIQTNQYPPTHPGTPFYSAVLDWLLLDDGTLDDTQGLATAIMVALGTNGLADQDDILPDPDSSDRNGWWGDLDADIIWNGWDIGSRLWLLSRSAIESPNSRQGATIGKVINYIHDAIQPFVTAGVCSTFTATAQRTDKQTITATIVIYRGPKQAIQLRYQIAWEEQRWSTQD
jgi:phage gp46-like protein